MPTEKTKKIGKIVIVILGVAILFFFLLPFLEEDNAATANAQAKKAVPQIFTSNPLSELVRKVYSMFARNQKRPQPRAAGYSFNESEMLAQVPLPAQRYAAQHEETESASSATAAAASYSGYGATEFINQEGEWEFAQQTAPEMAERGMHEVNVSDNAYDKYVRLERAAQYTGALTAPAQADIPQSKWARLWRPIKKLFGADTQEDDTISPSKTDTEKPFALAAASAGLGKDIANKPTGRQPRASLNMPNTGAFSAAKADPSAIYNLIDPEIVLNQSAEQLKETAREILDPQRAKQVIEKIEKDKRKDLREIAQKFNAQNKADFQQILEKEQDLNASSVNLVEKIFSPDCKTDELSISSFYDEDPTQPNPVCQDSDPLQESYVQQKQAELHRELTDALHMSVEKPVSLTTNLVVVLDKTTAGQPLDFLLEQEPTQQPAPSPQEQEQGIGQDYAKQDPLTATKGFLKILYEKKGCDKHDCYWIANSDTNLPNDLEDVVHHSGLMLQVDPLKTIDWLDVTAELASRNYSDVTQLNAGEFPTYVPYTKEEMMELNRKNKPVIDEEGNASASQDSFMFFVPSATKVSEMQEVLPNLARVIYDSPANTSASKQTSSTREYVETDNFSFNSKMLAGPILNAKERSDKETRGKQLRQEYLNRVVKNYNITQQAKKDFEQKATQAITQAAAEQEMEKIKKESSAQTGLRQWDFHAN